MFVLESLEILNIYIITKTILFLFILQAVIIINHVQTQMVYAIFDAFIAIFIGYIPASLGVPWYILIPIGIVVMYLGLKIIGEKVDFN